MITWIKIYYFVNDQLKLNLKIRHRVQLIVLRLVEVLLGNHDSLLKEVLIDGDSVLLGHQHSEAFTFYL